jgi:hypothetical protein
MKPHRGTVILVLGILSIVMGAVGIVLGPIAWAMGNTDLREIREGRMDPSGQSSASAGRTCGMIGTGLSVLWCGLVFVFVCITAIATLGSNANGTFEYIGTKVSSSS